MRIFLHFDIRLSIEESVFSPRKRFVLAYRNVRLPHNRTQLAAIV